MKKIISIIIFTTFVHFNFIAQCNANTGTDIQVVCDSYLWIDGNTYTSSNNTATHTLTNVSGCDSVVTLVLTINDSYTITNYDTICFGDSVVVGASVYKVSGTYSEVLSTIYNCDSNVITILYVDVPIAACISGNTSGCYGETVVLSSTCSNNSFTFQWNDANGPITGATSTSYSTGLTGLYSFTKNANWSSCSVNSDTLLVNLDQLNAPSNLATTNIELDRATMNWDIVANTHHYDIRFRDSTVNSGWTTILSHIPVTNISHLKSGLNNCTTYEWQIRAVCDHGGSSASLWSTSQYFTTLCPCVMPVNGVSSNIGLTTATILWDSVPESWDYIIRYKETTGAWSTWIYDTTSINSFLLTGLTTNTDYHWQVRSRCESTDVNNSAFTGYYLFSTGLCDLVSSTANSNIVCYGTSSGDIDLSITGGSGIYSYLWNTGDTIEDLINIPSGNYNVTISDTWGCTDNQSITITENAEISSTNNHVICNGESINVGANVYTSTGIYIDTLFASNACDSIVTTTLFVNNVSSGIDVQLACNSYTWIDGITYTSSNYTAKDTLQNSSGCDSIVTLYLTMNDSSSYTDVHTACNSYTWIDGNSYTSSNNTATHLLFNSSGCDSLISLDLTINNSTYSTDTQTACDMFTWIDGNLYTSSNNTATYTLVNSLGCDSIISLDLTLSYPNSSTDLQTACNSYMWIDSNVYTSSNNTATYILTNMYGCDSTVNLDLTINSINNGISNFSPSLTADAVNASYQWLNCDSGYTHILGETNQSFTAVVNGNYAVEISENNCIDTSVCEIVANVSIKEYFIGINLFPNPNNGTFIFNMSQYIDGKIEITNNIGQIVYQEKISSKEKQINISLNQVRGIYFVKLLDKDNKMLSVKKILIQ